MHSTRSLLAAIVNKATHWSECTQSAYGSDSLQQIDSKNWQMDAERVRFEQLVCAHCNCNGAHCVKSTAAPAVVDRVRLHRKAAAIH